MGFFKKIFSSANKNESDKSVDLLEGDIFYTHTDNEYQVYKLLVHDKPFNCYHVLGYEPTIFLPTKGDIDKLKVKVYHFPIDKDSFGNSTRITNNKITTHDLIGYHEYLRQTQEPNYYFRIANQYYQSGLRLTDEKKHNEAIDSYSKAVDLVSTFFEAIDNRAFCKMDMGLWDEAIEDFKLSLLINPNSLLAEFSIGECYFKMKEYQKAKVQFEKAHLIDPGHQVSIVFIKKIEALTN